jgi:hypothetical protein
MRLVLSCTRVLVVGVTSVARERARESKRERGSGPARLLPSLYRVSTRPSVPPPLVGPWTPPFIDIRRCPAV